MQDLSSIDVNRCVLRESVLSQLEVCLLTIVSSLKELTTNCAARCTENDLGLAHNWKRFADILFILNMII